MVFNLVEGSYDLQRPGDLVINMLILNRFATHRKALPAFMFGWGGRVIVGIYLLVHLISGHYQGDHSFIPKTSQNITDLDQLLIIALVVVILGLP